MKNFIIQTQTFSFKETLICNKISRRPISRVGFPGFTPTHRKFLRENIPCLLNEKYIRVLFCRIFSVNLGLERRFLYVEINILRL